MKIKELEEILSVSRSNIRFYEKEGLLAPGREENNYRNYSEADLLELKKILSLRKLGFTVEEIGQLQKEKTSITEIAQGNIHRLEAEMETLKEALALTKKLAETDAAYSAMDGDALWQAIAAAERSGAKFAELCKDIVELELTLLDSNPFFFGFKNLRKEYGIPLALGVFLLLLIIRGIANMLLWNGSFWDGFGYPLIIFAIASAILLPIWLLRKKAPKAAARLLNALMLLCVGFVLFMVLALAFLWIKSLFA